MEHGDACNRCQICLIILACFITEAPPLQIRKSIDVVPNLTKLTLRPESNKAITIGEHIQRAPILPCFEIRKSVSLAIFECKGYGRYMEWELVWMVVFNVTFEHKCSKVVRGSVIALTEMAIIDRLDMLASAMLKDIDGR